MLWVVWGRGLGLWGEGGGLGGAWGSEPPVSRALLSHSTYLYIISGLSPRSVMLPSLVNKGTQNISLCFSYVIFSSFSFIFTLAPLTRFFKYFKRHFPSIT